MSVEVQFLSPQSPREQLVGALLMVNAEARRELARDNLNRPNERWAELHEFMDALLDLLED